MCTNRTCSSKHRSGSSKEGYLEAVLKLCEDHGALCIFDEVKTGFRSGPGGYQEIAGIKPHLIGIWKSGCKWISAWSDRG